MSAQKTLVLAEKPSVARDIARVLGARTKGEGFIEGETHIVSWALGHLVSLCEPDELDPRYKKWRAEDLPILPEALKTKVLPKTKSQFSVLKKLLNSDQVGSVVCATDSGREGELIFRYIYRQAGCKKPVQRLWISSMTDQAIREGLASMKDDAEYDALYESARCRSEADWLVGMNASRAFTLRYDALLSIGRVQTPTLNLIVARDDEIARFTPEDYWEIRADFGDYQGLWLNPDTNQTRCTDEAQVKAIKAAVSGQTGTVEKSERERKTTPPPQLYDLTALQRDANRLLGYSAAKTLKVAQALYEQRKLITYPRTDSRYLPQDMRPRVARAMQSLGAPYDALAERALKQPVSSGRYYNNARVSDHHAIVPTGNRVDLSRLPADERAVFDLVARRLLAMHYPDYVYQSALVITRAAGHAFRTSGATPLEEGWRALYRDQKTGDEPDEAVPPLEVGETRAVQKVSSKKLKTKPPAPHTDASLLYMMERAGKLVEDEALRESLKQSGLGTPATRAAIIERLIEVGYVARRGKALASTEKGRQLIQVAPEEIKSPEMTGKWERALNAMATEPDAQRLAQRSERFMQSIRRYAAFLTEAAAQASQDVRFEREPRTARGKKPRAAVSPLGRKCPLCGEGEVTANAKAFGCSRWREGCKFTIWRDALERRGGPRLDVNAMKRLLDGQTIETEAGKITLVNGTVVLNK